MLRTFSLLLVFSLSSLIMAENWPRFRGPSGQGISRATNVPLEWSESKNLLWRQSIPGLGWSSPVVWGDRIFLTASTGAFCPKCKEPGPDKKSAQVLCLDANTGKILWNRTVFEMDVNMFRDRNSYATPTPAVDGRRVYAVFADGGIAALTLDGKVDWINREIDYYSEHGLGASPILYKGLLIMPFDGSSRGEDKKVGWQKPWDKSFLAAFDTETGKIRWKASRGTSRIGHVTPAIIQNNGKAMLVSAAGDVIQGYDPLTGERLWTAYSQGEGVVPSVVVGDGLIYTASGFEKPTIRAVRPDGKGEVTNTHIVWEQTRGVPKIPSFLYRSPYLYTISESGVAMCLDAKTGEIVWQQRIGGNHSASPIYAGGHIYFLSDEGETTIIKPGKDFQIVGRNSLPGRFQASMAVTDGRIYIRSDKELFAIASEQTENQDRQGAGN